MFDYSEIDKSVYIQKKYPVSDKEYEILNKQYGKLCWFAATKLARSNRREDEDLQDFHSEIQIGMFRSGSYYKRQVFIDKSIRYLKYFIPHMSVQELDSFNSLRNKWSGKKNHFGETEEAQLRQLLSICKKLDKRIPDPEKPLFMGKRFNIYCKAIIWNTYKALGQHVSKENERRNKEISLDEWSFLEGGDVQNGHGEENISYHASFYDDSIGVIKSKITQNCDSTTAQVFDIITDPSNHNRVFKQRQGKRKGIKINIIRKETKMSYYSIHKHLKKIKKVIECEMGIKPNKYVIEKPIAIPVKVIAKQIEQKSVVPQPIIIQKPTTRKIRPSVFAWFKGKNESEIRAISKEEFKAFVLEIDPSWKIAVDDKKVGIHLAWYRANYKKCNV